MKKLLIHLTLALTITLGSTLATAQAKPPEVSPGNVPALLLKANEAYAAQNFQAFRTAMEQLHQLRPNNSDYMYQLVIAHALLDEKSKAYELMLHMQQQGLAYDFSDTDKTMNIRGTEVFDYVNDLLKQAAAPMGESDTVFTLPDSVVLPETISWDETRQKFLVGTAYGGQVLAVDMNGQVSELLAANSENGLWAVFDILLDQARNRLWVSSAAIPKFKGFSPADKGRSALFEFDLETLKFIGSYPVPVDGRGHILGSMVMNPKGDIFIADRNLPVIYIKPAGEEKLKPFMASGDMTSLRGIALQPDGRIMYVADREMGILVIDLEGEKVAKLAVPATLNLGGIDGLYLWDNHLAIIQNGIKPQRVMRLQLDPSGTQVTAVRPLAIAQPEFDRPSFGVLKGKDLYYFGSSQWLQSADQRKPVTVLHTPLDSSADIVAPDMASFFDQQDEQAAKLADKKEKD